MRSAGVGALVAGVLLLMASVALAHDLFLKLDAYFLEPHAGVRITVLNGTFAKSEGFVAPERIADISAVSHGGRTLLPAATTWSRGPDSTSVLSLALGDPGTYVVGVSTRPREIDLRAEEFNAYLEEDGIPDVLEARRRSNELAQGARERYSKHVKAVFQVGTPRSEDVSVVLGYPAEIVLLENPYAIGRGTRLRVRCLVDGRPVANQMVLWGGEQRGRTLTEAGFTALLAANGFEEISIEPTRIYQFEDARTFLERAGFDAEILAREVDGRVMGAFVRARKPDA